MNIYTKALISLLMAIIVALATVTASKAGDVEEMFDIASSAGETPVADILTQMEALSFPKEDTYCWGTWGVLYLNFTALDLLDRLSVEQGVAIGAVAVAVMQEVGEEFITNCVVESM